MLKKTITYVDYNDMERTEDFYFYYKQDEVLEFEEKVAVLETLLKRGEMNAIIKVFKEIVLNAYGEKSPDGRRFIKSPELSKEFSETEAFSDLFMSLLENDGAGILQFIKAVMPKKTVDSIDSNKVKEFAAERGITNPKVIDALTGDSNA